MINYVTGEVYLRCFCETDDRTVSKPLAMKTTSWVKVCEILEITWVISSRREVGDRARKAFAGAGSRTVHGGGKKTCGRSREHMEALAMKLGFTVLLLHGNDRMEDYCKMCAIIVITLLRREARPRSRFIKKTLTWTTHQLCFNWFGNAGIPSCCPLLVYLRD